MVTEMPFQVQFDPQARISFAWNYALIDNCQTGLWPLIFTFRRVCEIEVDHCDFMVVQIDVSSDPWRPQPLIAVVIQIITKAL